MISQKTRTLIIWVVLVVWVINFGAGVVIEDHKPSESVNAIFMLIIGTLFALGKQSEPPAPPPEEGA